MTGIPEPDVITKLAVNLVPGDVICIAESGLTGNDRLPKFIWVLKVNDELMHKFTVDTDKGPGWRVGKYSLLPVLTNHGCATLGVKRDRYSKHEKDEDFIDGDAEELYLDQRSEPIALINPTIGDKQ